MSIRNAETEHGAKAVAVATAWALSCEGLSVFSRKAKPDLWFSYMGAVLFLMSSGFLLLGLVFAGFEPKQRSGGARATATVVRLEPYVTEDRCMPIFGSEHDSETVRGSSLGARVDDEYEPNFRDHAPAK